MPSVVLTPEELYKSAMRMRLTRAGLLKIMRENDAKAAVADADAVIIQYADAVAVELDNADAVR